MSYRKLSPSEIKIKELVSDNLKTYYDYQLNHYDLSDEIRSFSTSLIRTSNDIEVSREVLKIVYTFAFLHPNINLDMENFKTKAQQIRLTNKEMRSIQKSKIK